MKRKVIQLAGKTHVVSLPNKWVKKYGIIKGDELDVLEDGSKLIIGSDNCVELNNIEINLKKSDIFLRRIIDNPYRIGYNEVIFTFDHSDLFDEIQKEISTLMGYEIIEQGTNFCRVKCLAAGIEEEFENVFNRLIDITIRMLEETKEVFETKNIEEYLRIEKMELINNRFSQFCKRMINLGKIKEKYLATQTYRIICLHEEIGDNIRDLCRQNPNPSEQLSNTTLMIIEQMKLFQKIFRKYNLEKIQEFGKKDKHIEKRIINQLKENKDIIANHFLLSINSKVKHLTEDLSTN
jgi:phosphate uptake regulator